MILFGLFLLVASIARANRVEVESEHLNDITLHTTIISKTSELDEAAVHSADLRHAISRSAEIVYQDVEDVRDGVDVSDVEDVSDTSDVSDVDEVSDGGDDSDDADVVEDLAIQLDSLSGSFHSIVLVTGRDMWSDGLRMDAIPTDDAKKTATMIQDMVTNINSKNSMLLHSRSNNNNKIIEIALPVDPEGEEDKEVIVDSRGQGQAAAPNNHSHDHTTHTQNSTKSQGAAFSLERPTMTVKRTNRSPEFVSALGQLGSHAKTQQQTLLPPGALRVGVAYIDHHYQLAGEPQVMRIAHCLPGAQFGDKLLRFGDDDFRWLNLDTNTWVRYQLQDQTSSSSKSKSAATRRTSNTKYKRHEKHLDLFGRPERCATLWMGGRRLDLRRIPIEIKDNGGTISIVDGEEKRVVGAPAVRYWTGVSDEEQRLLMYGRSKQSLHFDAAVSATNTRIQSRRLKKQIKALNINQRHILIAEQKDRLNNSVMVQMNERFCIPLPVRLLNQPNLSSLMTPSSPSSHNDDVDVGDDTLDEGDSVVTEAPEKEHHAVIELVPSTHIVFRRTTADNCTESDLLANPIEHIHRFDTQQQLLGELSARLYMYAR